MSDIPISDTPISDTPPLPFSRPLRVNEVPPNGLTVRVVASEDERRALAADLEIVAVDRLEALISVHAIRRGLRVEGTLSADVVQSCVVTLEPVPATLNETIDLKFVADDGPPRPEIDLSDETVDLPDALEGDGIDLGTVVREHLALGLDPYPRLPGAVFESAPEEAPEPARRSPFADLEKLKKR